MRHGTDKTRNKAKVLYLYPWCGMQTQYGYNGGCQNGAKLQEVGAWGQWTASLSQGRRSAYVARMLVDD